MPVEKDLEDGKNLLDECNRLALLTQSLMLPLA